MCIYLKGGVDLKVWYYCYFQNFCGLFTGLLLCFEPVHLCSFRIVSLGKEGVFVYLVGIVELYPR